VTLTLSLDDLESHITVILPGLLCHLSGDDLKKEADNEIFVLQLLKRVARVRFLEPERQNCHLAVFIAANSFTIY